MKRIGKSDRVKEILSLCYKIAKDSKKDIIDSEVLLRAMERSGRGIFRKENSVVSFSTSFKTIDIYGHKLVNF